MLLVELREVGVRIDSVPGFRIDGIDGSRYFSIESPALEAEEGGQANRMEGAYVPKFSRSGERSLAG